jgi:hypothetical protein
MNKMIVVLLAAMLMMSSACGGDDSAGSGTIKIVADGEEGARQGFPFTEDGETVAFVDGWTLRFDKYVVAVGDVAVGSEGGEVAFEDAKTYIVDVKQGTPTLLEREVEAQRWDAFGFTIRPPGEQVVNAGGVSEADIARMKAGGLTYLIEGTATKGDASIRLSWEVAAPVRNEGCTNGVDDTQGVVVPVNGSVEARITIHTDHAFFDSLGTEESELRFEAIAAAAGADGVVTWADLKSQRLAALKGMDGETLRDEAGARVIYDPGAAQLEAADLQAYILFSMASQAHLNGEGLCTTRRYP